MGGQSAGHGQFRTILEQFREFEKFAPIDFDALFTYPGRVGMTYDEPIVILCVIIWCISRGSDVVSGELGRGRSKCYWLNQ